MTRCRQRVGSAAVDLDQPGVTGCRFCNHIGIAIGLVGHSLLGRSSKKRRLNILTFAILIVPAFAVKRLPRRSISAASPVANTSPCAAAPSSKFSAWMTGWFSYQSRRTFVDFDLHRTNVASTRGWCRSNPSASVLVAVEKSIGVAALPNATLDFNKITCGTWLGYGPVDQDLYIFHERLLQRDGKQQCIGLRPPAEEFQCGRRVLQRTNPHSTNGHSEQS